MECKDLIAEVGQYVDRDLGNCRTIAVQHALGELHRASNTLGDHNAELGQQTAQHVAELSALANNQIPRMVQKENSLLLFRLDRDKPHRRAGHCLADRLSIGSIGFAVLHVWLHIVGGYQTNIVAKSRNLACPMMAGAARLHANKARRKTLEESQKLRAPDRTIENDRSVFGDPVNLKHILGQIDTNCCDLPWVAPVLQ